jgi:hypothetical protein
MQSLMTSTQAVRCAELRGPLDLEKALAKEKPKGGERSAVGNQTVARAYSAMDYSSRRWGVWRL